MSFLDMSNIEAFNAITVGALYVFDYPEHYVTLPDYSARRGQIVHVVRRCTRKECDGPSEDMEGMFVIQAADGWEGEAFTSELVPLEEAP